MCKEELHNFYNSPNIRMMELRKMRLTRLAAQRQMHTKFWSKSTKEIIQFGDLGIDLRII
jgi:hypothetical protein